MRKDKLTAKFQSLKRVLIEDTKRFDTLKVSGRSRNGPLDGLRSGHEISDLSLQTFTLFFANLIPVKRADTF